MALYVFDACALIALVDQEEGSEYLATILANDENTCFVHSLNFCEVYYHAHRNSSEMQAKAIVEEFLELGFVLRDDMDTDFWQAAGNLKSQYRKISLADCCAVALSTRLGAELITSDHHELDELAALDEYNITFFR